MNIAILGLGTIGSGVDELLKGNDDICVKRILDIRAWQDNMTTDINDIINDESIETVVETMGGVHPALDYALKCINSGKNYVTANKLLVSKCAKELQSAADKNGVALLFSAACGGGIPFLYNLMKTKQTDSIVKLGGILNGTTNFILDKLFCGSEDYEEALREAQALGYAERDPSSDVDGLDTMRKLMLSCAVAFGRMPLENSIPCYGISKITKTDVQYAKCKGGTIKLIAGAEISDGKLQTYVIPKLFDADSPEGSIRLNVNYAWYSGKRIGTFSFTGQGAGKFPTANNIIRDIYAIMMSEKRMLPEGFTEGSADNSAKKTYYIRVPENCAGRFEGIAHVTENADGFVLIETNRITFKELKLALNDTNDYFAMLLED